MVRLLLIFLLICSPVFAKTIPELNSNTSPTTSDLTYTVDVSDTTDGSSGTGKKATIAQVFKAANMTIDGTNVGVNSLAPGARLDVVGTVRATAFSGDGSGLTGVSGAVSDDAYSASWDGDTTTPASKNSIYDKIETIATGSGGWTDGGANVYVSTSTDKVGIGSTTPRAKVDVIGTAYIDDTLTVGGSSQIQFTTNGETISNTNDGYNDFSGGITTSGNIGVGTITASSRLTVSGTATATAFSGPLTGNVTGNASTATALAADPTGCSAGDYVSDIAANGTLTCGTPVGGGSSGWTDGGTNIYNTATSDNVGIGTTTPTSKLTVAGSITTSGTTAGSVVLSEASANGSNTVTISAPSSLTGDRTCTVEDDSTPFDSCVTANVDSGWTDGGTNVYTTTTTDTVGIGTTTPTTTLEIVRQSSNPPLMVSATATGDGNYLIVRSDGNIGINTVSPTARLQVTHSTVDVLKLTSTVASASNSGAGIQSYENDGAAMASGDRLAFYTFGGAVDSANTLVSGGAIAGFASGAWSGTSSPTDIVFQTAPSGSITRSERLRVTSEGNVGIGTTIPSKKLAIFDSCIQLKSPDNSLSNCCVDNSDVFTCTGI